MDLWINIGIHTNTNTYTILYPIPHQSPSIPPSPAVHLQALPQRRLQRLRGSASALLPAQGTLQLGAGGLLLGHGDFNHGKMGRHDNGFFMGLLWDFSRTLWYSGRTLCDFCRTVWDCMGFMLICNGTLNGILSGTSGTISFRILFHISFWVFMNKHSGFIRKSADFAGKL